MQNMFRNYVIIKLSKYPSLLYICKSTYRFILLILLGSKHTRKFILINDKKIIYVNNPKVACSSIKSSLIEEKGVLETENIHLVIKKIAEVRKKVPNNDEYYKFTFVRNPFSRLVSCYKNKVCNEGTMGADDFKTYLFGYISKSQDFHEFVRKICKIPDRLSEPHFMSQYYLLYDKNVPVVDYIGKLENINQDYRHIQKKYKLNALLHFNKTSDVNWMDYYTFETAELVYRKFKNDFSELGYDKEYYNLIKYLNNKN